MLTTLSHRFLLGTSALAVVLMASPYGTHATGTEAGRDTGGAVLRTSQRIDGRVASAGVAGACCQADGTCTLTTAAACGGVGGGFLGEGTVCLNDGDGDGRDDACPCVLASDCNDGNVCTEETCVAGVCQRSNNTVPCNDGNACTTGDTCSGGTCVGGAPLNCNDGNVCTTDSCVPASGCQNINNTVPCSDGNACTTSDTCSDGNCVGGPPPNCDDGNVCTTDSCVPASGCQNINNSAACSDGQFCTVGDTCSGGACSGGGARSCGDGIACTADSCNDVINSCVHPVIPGCNDCDGNGIPDPTDLENCPVGVTACDDCNFTALQDSCDIAGDPLLDQNAPFGVPDACVFADPVTAVWTADIWGLPGGDYPDNIGHAAGKFVTLPNLANITLNTGVEIEGLRVLQGGFLHVNELTPGAEPGDLTIRQASPGGIRILGTVAVAHTRNVTVRGGVVTMQGAGRYVAEALGNVPVSVKLTARKLALKWTLDPQVACPTEQLLLTKNMVVETLEDFVMDGTNTMPCPFGGASESATAQLGFRSPPISNLRPAETALAATASASAAVNEITMLIVGRDFTMLSAAELCVGCDASRNAPTANVDLNRDFDNQSRFPSLFDWSEGKLTLLDSGSVHFFEVAGLELGASVEGFGTDVDTLDDTKRHENFSMGTIEVAGGAEVRFVNNQPNTTNGSEALYVQQLVLGPNATVVLQNSNVYCCDLIDNGATIVRNGSGDLIQTDCPLGDIPAMSPWGVAVTAILLLGGGAVLARRSAARRSA